MRHQLELAYLGIEVPDPASLTPFFGDVIGLVPGEPAAGRRVTWRNDDKAQRLIVSRARPTTPRSSASRPSTTTRSTRRRRASTPPASTSTRAPTTTGRAGGSTRLARTTAPWGVAVEIVAGLDGRRRRRSRRRSCRAGSSPRASASATSCSPRPPSTSRTAFAHRRARAWRSPTGSRWRSPTGIELEVRFFHCNARHHTLALAKAPFELPQTLHHVMFETNERDDVGAAFDRAWATDLADPQRARPPRQRRHVQLLRRQPRRLPGRGRPRRPRRSPTTGTTTAATTASAPGATSRCASHDRRTPTPTSSSSASARSAARSRSCSPSSAARSSSSSAGPSRTRCRGRCTSTTRSAASSSRAASATSCAAISEPAEVYEWRNAAGTTLLRFGRVGDGAVGLAGVVDVLPARRSRRCSTGERARCSASTSAAASRSPASSQHDDARRRRRRPTGDVVAARYVVGCDGANSTVRDAARRRRSPTSGSSTTGSSSTSSSTSHRVFDPINLQICDPARPTTAVSGGPGRRRWEFMRLPARVARRAQRRGRGRGSCSRRGTCTPATPARAPRRLHVQRPLRRAVAGRAGAPRRRRRPPDAAVRRPGHVRRPPRRRQPRVEARPRARRARRPTRCSTPTSRSGCRAPAGDRVLDGARQGHLRPRPRRGRRARRGHGRRRRTGDRRRAPPTCPASTPASIHPDSPHAGRLFVQGTVDGRPFDDVHGAGWRLVTVDADADRPRPGDAPRGSRRSAAASCRRSPTDPVYGRWFAEHDATCALQRPDFHLYGTAADAAGAAACSTTSATRLAHPARTTRSPP